MNKLIKNLSTKKKIIIFSVGRSDLSILTNLIKKIQQNSRLVLDLAICGAHSSGKFGKFKNELILNNKNIHYLKSNYQGYQNKDIINYFTANLNFTKKIFAKKKFDAAIIMGDRYEMLAISIACLNFRIPIMHFCGGSITDGSLDNINRFCISKMAKAHFVETKHHKKNLNEIGIKKNIFIVGAPALEMFKKNLLSKKQLEKKFKFKLKKKIIVCTFHPETTQSIVENEKKLLELIKFLKSSENSVIFTYPNADQGFGKFIQIIKKKLKSKNILLVKNLGRTNYYSFLKHCNLIIGNSSSGIIESASFKKPVINLGIRQKNRYAMKNVINCKFNFKEILAAFKKSKSKKFQEMLKKIKNEYELPNTSDKSIQIILKILSNDQG